jgi:hypothetical protein
MRLGRAVLPWDLQQVYYGAAWQEGDQHEFPPPS